MTYIYQIFIYLLISGCAQNTITANDKEIIYSEKIIQNNTNSINAKEEYQLLQAQRSK